MISLVAYSDSDDDQNTNNNNNNNDDTEISASKRIRCQGEEDKGNETYIVRMEVSK